MKRKVIRWIKVFLLIYCLIGIGIYSFQEKLIFRGEPLPKDHVYNFTQPHKEVNLPYNEHSNINIIQFLADSPQVKGVVLYFHGNRRNIARYEQYSGLFTKKGYEVWMIDYPGYGKSTGELTEAILYDWALVLYKLARVRFAPDDIVIYGKSLGTGIASQLASVRDCYYLVLETPYYSAPSAVGQYLPVYPMDLMIRYKLPVYKHLQKVTAPVLIFQGTNDWIITNRNASRLKPYLKYEDEFISIDGGSHNDLPDYKEYRSAMEGILL